MFGANRRNTLGQTPGARGMAAARTPTKPRITDITASSTIKKSGPDGGRLSLSQQAGQPRLSLFQRASAVASRDVKSLVTANVKKIHQFLSKYEGDEAPPESTIRSPNGRTDFNTIFELIYQHLSKDYEVPAGRHEDEISQIFRGLGYPTQIKNSFFQPMGSSHGYPHLLDALGWLVDMVNTSYEVAGVTQNILIGDFTEQNKGNAKLFKYSFVTATYKDYTTNRHLLRSQGFAEEKTLKFKEFLQKEDYFDEQYSEAQAVLEQLMYECEELAADRGKEQQLKEDQARFKDDIRKATEYLSTVDAVLKNCERELEVHVAETVEKRNEFDRASENVEYLKKKVEEQKQNHGLSGEAVRKMNSEMRKDVEILRERNEQHAELSKELWLIGEKDKEAFREQLTNFMQLMKVVNNISAGLSFEMHQFSEPRNEDELQDELDRMSKKWVPSMAQQFNKKKLEVETQISRIQQKTETLTQRVQMVNEKLDELKRIESREDRVRRKEKEEWKDERSKLEHKIDCLENELEVLNEKMHEAGSLEKQIEMEKEAYEKLKEQIDEKTSKLQRIIKEKVDIMVAELTASDSKYMKMMKNCDELVETAQSLKL